MNGWVHLGYVIRYDENKQASVFLCEEILYAWSLSVVILFATEDRNIF